MKFRIMRYNIHTANSKLLQGGPSQMKVDFFRGRRGQPQTLEEFYGENDNDWADDEQDLEEVPMVRERRPRYRNKFDDYDDNGGPGRPQTIEEYNAELEEGSAQIARGECMTSAELWEEMKKW